MGGDTAVKKRDRDKNSPSPNNSAKRHAMSKGTDSEKLDMILAMLHNVDKTVSDVSARVVNLETTSADLLKRMEEKEKQWEVERNELIERNKSMEYRLNQLERRERQNNAIIRGIRGISGSNAKDEVKKILGKLSDPVEVESATTIRPQNDKQGALLLIKFKSWEDKISVFKQKKALVCESNGADGKIFIDDDLTRREQEIRFYQRCMRKEEKTRNPETAFKCRGGRVCVNGEWRIFNERTKTFENEKN